MTNSKTPQFSTEMVEKVARAIEQEFYRRVDAGNETGFDSIARAALEAIVSSPVGESRDA